MRRRSSLTLLVVVSVIWGSSWIANSVLSGIAPPVHLAVLRYGAAFLFLAGALGVSAITGGNARLLAGATGPASGDAGLVPGSETAPVSIATAPRENAFVPSLAVLPALGSPDAERLNWYRQSLLLGCTMFALPELLTLAAAEHGAAAFIPLVYAGLPLGLSVAAGAPRAPAILAMGAMLVLLNGSLSFTAGKLGWAVLIVVAVALQGWSLVYARAHLAAVSTLRGCLTQAGAATGVLVISLHVWPEPATMLSLRAWSAAPTVALCTLAGLGVAVAYPVYYRLLGQLEPEQLAVSTWLQTLVAVGESAALLRQRPGWPMVCAAAVLVACTSVMLQQAQPHAGRLRFLPDE